MIGWCWPLIMNVCLSVRQGRSKGWKAGVFYGFVIHVLVNQGMWQVCPSVWLGQVVVWRSIGLSQMRAWKKGFGVWTPVFDYCIMKYNTLQSFEKQSYVNRPRFEVTVTVCVGAPSAPKVRWLELVEGFWSPKTVHGKHDLDRKRCFWLLIEKLQYMADTMTPESRKSVKIWPSNGQFRKINSWKSRNAFSAFWWASLPMMTITWHERVLCDFFFTSEVRSRVYWEHLETKKVWFG